MVIQFPVVHDNKCEFPGYSISGQFTNEFKYFFIKKYPYRKILVGDTRQEGCLIFEGQIFRMDTFFIEIGEAS